LLALARRPLAPVAAEDPPGDLGEVEGLFGDPTQREPPLLDPGVALQRGILQDLERRVDGAPERGRRRVRRGGGRRERKEPQTDEQRAPHPNPPARGRDPQPRGPRPAAPTTGRARRAREILATRRGRCYHTASCRRTRWDRALSPSASCRSRSNSTRPRPPRASRSTCCTPSAAPASGSNMSVRSTTRSSSAATS